MYTRTTLRSPRSNYSRREKLKVPQVCALDTTYSSEVCYGVIETYTLFDISMGNSAARFFNKIICK
jgi:hypothetical protein